MKSAKFTRPLAKPGSNQSQERKQVGRPCDVTRGVAYHAKEKVTTPFTGSGRYVFYMVLVMHVQFKIKDTLLIKFLLTRKKFVENE